MAKSSSQRTAETGTDDPTQVGGEPAADTGTPVTGELVKREQGAPVARVKEDPKAIAAQASLKALDVELKGTVFEEVQSGGVAKWVDLTAYQMDPHAPQSKGVAGTGEAIVGLLVGRFEMPAKDGQGEVNEETGEIVRHYYAIRVSQHTPVQVKNESGESVREMAEPGDIVNLGHRFRLMLLRDYCEDVEAGAQIAVYIKPHSRIKINGGRTMWTFQIKRAVLRHPVKAILQTAAR